MFGFVWWILIGIVAGWLAGQIMRGRGFGLIGNLIIGVVGASLGGMLFSVLGLYSQGTIGSIVTATAGAIVLLLVVGWLKKQ